MKVGKTNIIKKTIDPKWDFVFNNVFVKVGDCIMFLIYDWDFLVSDDYMGQCKF